MTAQRLFLFLTLFLGRGGSPPPPPFFLYCLKTELDTISWLFLNIIFQNICYWLPKDPGILPEIGLFNLLDYNCSNTSIMFQFWSIALWKAEIQEIKFFSNFPSFYILAQICNKIWTTINSFFIPLNIESYSVESCWEEYINHTSFN